MNAVALPRALKFACREVIAVAWPMARNQIEMKLANLLRISRQARRPDVYGRWWRLGTRCLCIAGRRNDILGGEINVRFCPSWWPSPTCVRDERGSSFRCAALLAEALRGWLCACLFIHRERNPVCSDVVRRRR